MSCGLGGRCSSDPVLLWLWHRLAAVAPIRPLACKPPCAMSMALKKKKSHSKFIPQIFTEHLLWAKCPINPLPRRVGSSLQDASSAALEAHEELLMKKGTASAPTPMVYASQMILSPHMADAITLGHAKGDRGVFSLVYCSPPPKLFHPS